jgi:putative restriction endonuclease
MSKAVFTTKISPTYDDLPEVRYHFPRSYLNQVRGAIGDRIVYYEPRRSTGALSSRGGRQAYFAVASVVDVKPDHQRADHFYAYVRDYLDFDRLVSFREGSHYFESALRRTDGQTSKGMFGRAVRTVPDSEFELILAAGFGPDLKRGETTNQDTWSDKHGGLSEDQALFEGPTQQRPLIETTLTRPFRDEAFRRHVRAAYDNRCALSGLKLINGGGRPEVQAAHIRPVASDGPDSIRNGLALSGTLHWMFDRGLVAIDDDWRILRASSLPEDVGRLIVPDGHLIVPDDETTKPHPSFLRFHRENVFKG